MSTRTDPRAPRPPRSSPRVRIDPRIRERRIEVARTKGRRRLRVLTVVTGAAVLGAGGWLVLHSALLDVDRVVVTGAVHASAPEIRDAAGVDRGDPLVLVDLGAVERRVERLPWVDEARVDRHLPGELAIQVTERTPVAWASRSEAEIALVDDRGRVVVNATEVPSGLPELTGLAALPPPGGRVRPAIAQRALPALPVELRAQVTRVGVVGADLVLGLRDGPEVRLGSADRLGDKGRAALAVLQTLDPPYPAYLDVRVPEAPVTG